MTKIRLVQAFVLALEAITASLAEASSMFFLLRNQGFCLAQRQGYSRRKMVLHLFRFSLGCLSVCWSVGRFFKCHSCRIWKSFAASQTLKIYLQRMIHCVAWNMGNAKMFPVHLEISPWTDFSRKLQSFLPVSGPTHSFSGFHRLVDKLFDFKLKKDPAEAILHPSFFGTTRIFRKQPGQRMGWESLGFVGEASSKGGRLVGEAGRSSSPFFETVHHFALWHLTIGLSYLGFLYWASFEVVPYRKKVSDWLQGHLEHLGPCI